MATEREIAETIVAAHVMASSMVASNEESEVATGIQISMVLYGMLYARDVNLGEFQIAMGGDGKGAERLDAAEVFGKWRRALHRVAPLNQSEVLTEKVQKLMREAKSKG